MPGMGLQRRDFLRAAGVGAAAFCLPRPLFAEAPVRKGRPVQGRKLNIACVGCSGKGGSDIEGVSSENIVALCDVDYDRARGAFRKYPKAKQYRDYRAMLLEMDREIDAVTVSTPDHMHFPVAMMAIQMGKHVFVQKPLAHTVWEAREIAAAARRHRVVTQMGIQGHCGEGIRLLKEWLDADAIGPVREVHYWTDRPIWPQGIPTPDKAEPVPSSLDWNLWLGVARERPYNSAYAPFKWRGWWDFGCGALGDIGCHMMDAGFHALEFGSPTSVEAVSEGGTEDSAPVWSIVTYQFPARGDKPPVKVIWHDGKKMPPRPEELEPERKLPGGGGGQLFFGEKGTILVNDMYCGSCRIIPEAKMQEFERPPKTLPRSPGLYREWILACKGEGPAPGANFDYAGPLSEMVLMGNLAVRTGQRIEWDGTHMVCTNIEAANRFVRKAYRVF
ncbi:MAG: Gfo/Idh/MocA family oxidoreductase [Lentisphaeria bacterium]|nr:Gfo/Idh/MocA family oxidoreductase [Lentisphaeria bacterium]